MVITTRQINEQLTQHQLLVQTHRQTDESITFSSVVYDSRKATPGALFVVKGAYQIEYVNEAIRQGIAGIVVADDILDQLVSETIPVWQVNDSQKALAVISAEYFGHPEKQLKLIGITGTKGKSSTTYFLHQILQNETQNKTAMLSTIDTVLGPDPKDRFKSKLTTPESFELWEDLHQAVANGLTHVVMEVSSQAYLKSRVYGLEFSVGAFLNITPDHIGPEEHPDFADYLRHKLMLVEHSQQFVINGDGADAQQFIDHAHTLLPDQSINVYQRESASADVTYQIKDAQLTGSTFSVATSREALAITGDYQLPIPGTFNIENAMAAITIAGMLGASQPVINESLAQVQIPGRMELLAAGSHGHVVVDYAHNYTSVNNLLDFLQSQRQKTGKTILVLGSPGNKAESRRADFGRVISEWADVVVLTTDDSQFEEPQKIANEIAEHITNDQIDVRFEMDRIKAIHQAIAMAGPDDLVVVAGKGDDHFQKKDGRDEPYIGDRAAAEQAIQES